MASARFNYKPSCMRWPRTPAVGRSLGLPKPIHARLRSQARHSSELACTRRNRSIEMTDFLAFGARKKTPPRRSSTMPHDGASRPLALIVGCTTSTTSRIGPYSSTCGSSCEPSGWSCCTMGRRFRGTPVQSVVSGKKGGTDVKMVIGPTMRRLLIDAKTAFPQ
jgi:hypothetical protein